MPDLMIAIGKPKKGLMGKGKASDPMGDPPDEEEKDDAEGDEIDAALGDAFDAAKSGDKEAFVSGLRAAFASYCAEMYPDHGGED